MIFLNQPIRFIYPAILFLVSCTVKQSGFVSERQHQDDIIKLKAYNADKLQQLSKYGVNENSGLSLLFYFDADDSSKLNSLAGDLLKLNNHVNEIHRSAKDQTLWVLSANSSLLKMDSSSLNKWTTALCDLGFSHDCEMEGWNPVSE